MFYFAIGLIVVGYLIFIGLMKVKCTSLLNTCPLVIISTALVSLLLFLTDHAIAASFVLLLGAFFSVEILLALRQWAKNTLGSSQNTINRP